MICSESIHRKARLFSIVLLSGLVLFDAYPSLAQAELSPSDERKRRTEAANEALLVALQNSAFDFGLVQRLLADGQYKQVDRIYRELIDQYKKDVRFEARLIHAFNGFQPGEGFTIQQLDAWVESTQSGISHAARGIYMAGEGFQIRGTKWAHETSHGQFNAMLERHYAAVVDFVAATEKEPDITPVYVWWIQVAKASNTPYTPDQILAQAIEHDPKTYYARFQYMVSLQPRWGGSHDLMRAFAEECAPAGELNPRIWSLKGEVYADLGGLAWHRGDYAEAANQYGVALIYGDRTEWLRHRAGCYYNLGAYQLALNDLTRVLMYSPQDALATKWIANAEQALRTK